MFHNGCDKGAVSSEKLQLHGAVLVVDHVRLIHHRSYPGLVLLQNNLSTFSTKSEKTRFSVSYLKMISALGFKSMEPLILY